MFGLPHLVALGAALGIAGAVDTPDQVRLSGHQPAPSHVCTHPPFAVHLVSRSPLVMYLEGFLTADERAHLQHLAQGHFKHSAVQGAGGDSAIHSVRTSQSTSVERDAVVRCIEDRALALQGFDTPASHLEPIQLVKYGPKQHYHFHTDWFTDAETHATAAQGGNRVSSIFAYVKAVNVTGGGTNFPQLEVPRDERWCRFVDCDEEHEKGLTFRPVEGNAVYWENLLADGSGRGDQRTLHAGLPVVSGEKIGMNIWTREAPLPPGVRGEDEKPL